MTTRSIHETLDSTDGRANCVDSAEEKLRHRTRELEHWLRSQGVDVRNEQRHLDEGSRERLYWHYGYLVGLRDALNALVREESLPLH